jgi:hypothetical protein
VWRIGLQLQYAVYDSYSKDTKRYGLMATMDVYGFNNLSRDQETAAAIWVGNQLSQDYILVGWHVSRVPFLAID